MTATTPPTRLDALTPELMLDWLEHSPQLLALSDATGHLLWVNRRFESRVGHGAGSSILDLFDADPIRQLLAPTTNRSDATRFETAAGPRWRAEFRRHADAWLWTLHESDGGDEPASTTTRCASVKGEISPFDSEPANQYLDVAVQLGQIGIWRHDLSTGNILFNERARALLDISKRVHGWPIEEIRALIHPGDRERVADAARAALTSDRPTDIEARHRCSDGRWRDVLTRRVVQFDSLGAPVAFVGVVLDVTEQMQHKRLVTDMALRLERTASAAGLGIWSRDLENSTGEWNAVTFAMVGCDPERGALSPHEFFDQIVHPDDRARMHATWADLIAKPGHFVEHDYRVVLKDGTVRWLRDRAQRETWNGRDMVFGATLDITEPRRAAALLHSTTERAALATRSAGIGTWEMAADGGHAHWDDQMFKLRGLAPTPQPPSREERLAMVHRDDVRRVLDAGSRGFDAGTVSAYDFRVRLPNGTYRWLASRSSPMFDGEGRVIRRIGVNWDITQRKQAERDRRRKVVAERESRAKSEFLARMSHELRTPLNAVLGFSELLRLELLDQLTPRHQAHLGHVQAAGRHLLGLIDDVLDLSSLEAGKLRLELQPVALAYVVAQALPLLGALAEQHRVTLHDDSQPVWVRGDPKRLLQVLLNLLSNAIKYNRPEGSVHVGTRLDHHDVLLTVADTGRGLSEDQLAHLFEPFNRLGVERENLDGTGIGLAVVKALVTSMGGSIDVRSRPGEGTLFELRMPAVDAARVRPPVPAAKATRLLRSTAPRQGRLLYVEDNPVNIVLVEELVTMVPGLTIESVVTGHDGVERARALQPDLVLIDMQLPDFDGFEVLRRLRADDQTRGIRCIALSANAMPEDIALALRSGFEEYWTKPIDFEGFTAGLRRLFPEPTVAA